MITNDYKLKQKLFDENYDENILTLTMVIFVTILKSMNTIL